MREPASCCRVIGQAHASDVPARFAYDERTIDKDDASETTQQDGDDANRWLTAEYMGRGAWRLHADCVSGAGVRRCSWLLRPGHTLSESQGAEGKRPWPSSSNVANIAGCACILLPKRRQGLSHLSTTLPDVCHLFTLKRSDAGLCAPQPG